jgi:hypothetical protein
MVRYTCNPARIIINTTLTVGVNGLETIIVLLTCVWRYTTAVSIRIRHESPKSVRYTLPITALHVHGAMMEIYADGNGGVPADLNMNVNLPHPEEQTCKTNRDAPLSLLCIAIAICILFYTIRNLFLPHLIVFKMRE